MVRRPNDSKVIAASEIAQNTYCPLSWYLERWGSPPRAKSLFSRRFGISGRPDNIVKDDHSRALIPLELKGGYAIRPRWGNVLQLAAYSLLIEETYAPHVPYGLIVYNDGKQHRVDFNLALRSKEISVIEDMRRCLKEGCAEQVRLKGRCDSCSVRRDCRAAR